MKKNFPLLPIITFILLMIAFVILVNSVPSKAQTNLQDVIYMKDGSIYRGVIREQGLNIVKIQITGGSVFVLTRPDIDTILLQAKVSFNGATFRQKSFGYFNITEIGVPVGTMQDYSYWYSNNSKIAGGFTAQTIHGYRFYSHFLGGTGVALDLIQHPMVQLFADARYEMLKGRATPFVYADLGYNFDVTSDLDDGYMKTTYSGGVTWGAGGGMRFNFENVGAFLFDVGYKLVERQEHITYVDDNSDIITQYSLQRIVIRIGLAF